MIHPSRRISSAEKQHMSIQVVVQGTIQQDGTLVLDERVPMPACRVQVTVQPIMEPPREDPFWESMQRIWAEQKARGHEPRSKEQIDAEIEALRNDAEEEMQATERLHDECQRAATQRK